MDTLTLTFWQQRRLEQQLRSTHDARVYRRTLAILEVASGEAVSSVARRLRVTPRSVYHCSSCKGRKATQAPSIRWLVTSQRHVQVIRRRAGACRRKAGGGHA